MNPSAEIRSILDQEGICYQILEHPAAYTAMEVAEAQHIIGQQVIKAIIVKADEQLIMCVLPAIQVIDFEKLRKTLKLKEAHLAPEGQVALLFPAFEVGAMPPFGQLANLKVYADKSLEENEAVAFNAGSHSEMIRLKFRDYVHFVKPIFVDIGVHI